MRIGHPWTTAGVKAARAKTNSQRDVRNFSGAGKYSQLGVGPYPWKRAGRPSFAGDALAGMEPESWHRAPDTSHLASFRFVHGLDDSDPVMLQIQYRDGNLAEFYGENGRQQRLEFIWEIMKASEHPGQVGWSHLSLEEFPYTSTS